MYDKVGQHLLPGYGANTIHSRPPTTHTYTHSHTHTCGATLECSSNGLQTRMRSQRPTCPTELRRRTRVQNPHQGHKPSPGGSSKAKTLPSGVVPQTPPPPCRTWSTSHATAYTCRTCPAVGLPGTHHAQLRGQPLLGPGPLAACTCL